LLRHDVGKEMVSEKPDDADGDGDEPEEVEHALKLETDEVVAPGAVGLRAEGVEGGGEAGVDCVAGDGCRHWIVVNTLLRKLI